MVGNSPGAAGSLHWSRSVRSEEVGPWAAHSCFLGQIASRDQSL